MILYQKVTHSLTLKLVKTKNVFEIHFIHSAEAPDSPGCLNIEGFKKLQENFTMIINFIKAWVKTKKES